MLETAATATATVARDWAGALLFLLGQDLWHNQQRLTEVYSRRRTVLLVAPLARDGSWGAAMPSPRASIRYKFGKLIGFVRSTKMNKSVRSPEAGRTRSPQS
eukprot:scaffold105899_cov65-Phaeocystis_antarctica.AAC.1